MANTQPRYRVELTEHEIILIQRKQKHLLAEALEQARKEYGVLGSLSGETLIQMDKALRAARMTPLEDS